MPLRAVLALDGDESEDDDRAAEVVSERGLLPGELLRAVAPMNGGSTAGDLTARLAATERLIEATRARLHVAGGVAVTVTLIFGERQYALARDAATALGQVPQHSVTSTLDLLFAEAKAGNVAARSIFKRAGRYLAVGLSNVIQLFDPALIILSGERMRYDYLYADDVLAEMQALTLDAGRNPCQVAMHAWGDLVWARGATALALSSVSADILGAARG